MMKDTHSLRIRLGFAAALLGFIALAAVGLTVTGLTRIAERIDASIAAEQRIDRYSTLSTRVSTFMVIAVEAIQTGLPPAERSDRVSALSADIEDTFRQLRQDNQAAVAAAERFGLDAQSRLATRSLLIASIDAFSSGFDPQLNAAVTGEIRTRDLILGDIARLRGRLTVWAGAIGLAAVAMTVVFYLGLIQPQFRRLRLLGGAARRIGQGDFDIDLPGGAQDEIGNLMRETNNAAAALAGRAAQVDAEWDRLRETIAERTEALRQANAELSQTDENRRRFFADISHELRTPLTVIVMEAQLARKPGGDPAEAIDIIENRALRLNRRIDDLLRVARSERGVLELAAAPFDLTAAVRDAVADTRAHAHSAGMAVDCPDSPPAIAIGDANWMRQITTGLLENAVRHARDGGLIQVTVQTADGWAQVHVTDNGPGVAADPPEAIFERFAKAHNSEGFGIGLALAKWVMEQQGGQIAVTSPLPQADRPGDNPGTRMTLRLPLAPE